jgi:hypothetical protein
MAGEREYNAQRRSSDGGGSVRYGGGSRTGNSVTNSVTRARPEAFSAGSSAPFGENGGIPGEPATRRLRAEVDQVYGLVTIGSGRSCSHSYSSLLLESGTGSPRLRLHATGCAFAPTSCTLSSRSTSSSTRTRERASSAYSRVTLTSHNREHVFILSCARPRRKWSTIVRQSDEVDVRPGTRRVVHGRTAASRASFGNGNGKELYNRRPSFLLRSTSNL